MLTPARKPLNRRVSELIMSSTHRLRRSGSFGDDIPAAEVQVGVTEASNAVDDEPMEDAEVRKSSGLWTSCPEPVASASSPVLVVTDVDTGVNHPMDVDDVEPDLVDRENLKPRRGRPRKSEQVQIVSEGLSPRYNNLSPFCLG